MANISTDDVRTYIVDLIEKELGYCGQEDNEAVKSRKTDKEGPQTGRNVPEKRRRKV